jgi:hypothetical protein
MRIVACPIDFNGRLWTVAPFDGALLAPEDRTSFQLHASRPDRVEHIGAMALRAGLVVGAYEDEPGQPSRSFSRRVASIAASLCALGFPAAGCEPSPRAGAALSIDGERDVIAWFLQSRADVLLLGPVAFEKRRRASAAHVRRLH